MIKLVMGLKGTGKTKELISTVNSVAKTAEGSVICLERDDKLRYEIDPKVRLISTDEYVSTTTICSSASSEDSEHQTMI